MKHFILGLSLLLGMGLFHSCSDDDDSIEPVHEEISRVQLQQYNGSTLLQTYVWQEGQTIPSIQMTSGLSYRFVLSFWSPSGNGFIDITPEIIEEKDEHFVAYSKNADFNLTLQRATDDVTRTDGNKLGLITNMSAVGSNGSIQIELIHQPSSVSDANGFGAYTGGERDIQISFPVVVSAAR